MAPPWELRRRGLKDSLRHDQRVKEAIRKNLRELIAEEAIITSDGQKRVRIPLRYLEQYRFKYGQPQEGVGQGSGKQGDLLGRQGGAGNDPGDGMAGDQPGELTYEVEGPQDELTAIMLEDLALPRLAGGKTGAAGHDHHPSSYGCPTPWLTGQSGQAPHSARQHQAQRVPRGR